MALVKSAGWNIDVLRLDLEFAAIICDGPSLGRPEKRGPDALAADFRRNPDIP